MTATMTNLFGEEVPVPQDAPAKRGLDPHQQMLAIHGKCAGFTCGSCKDLKRSGKNRPYFKCSRFGISASEATDWRSKWQACGLFEDLAYDPTP